MAKLLNWNDKENDMWHLMRNEDGDLKYCHEDEVFDEIWNGYEIVYTY